MVGQLNLGAAAANQNYTGCHKRVAGQQQGIQGSMSFQAAMKSYVDEHGAPTSMPPAGQRIMHGHMDKQIVSALRGMYWQPRVATLTRDHLLFAKHFDPGSARASTVSPISIPELQELFQRFDTDKSGALNLEEATALLFEMKLCTAADDARELFEELDVDDSGQLDWEELVLLARQAFAATHVRDYIPLEQIVDVSCSIEAREDSDNGHTCRRRPHTVSNTLKRSSTVSKRDAKRRQSLFRGDERFHLSQHLHHESIPDYDTSTSECHLTITTMEMGHNAGRTYVHRVPDEDAQAWFDNLKLQVHDAKARFHQRRMVEKYGNSTLSMWRVRTHEAYTSNRFQYGAAILILFAFILDMLESQLLPEPRSQLARDFFIADAIITCFFTVELMINLFANSNDHFRPFVGRPSNWFDLVIVVVSLLNVVLSALGASLPSAKMLRMLRLGRAIRLFSALKDLNRLLTAVACAMYPVCNAFLILLITSAMYAVLGTNFFRERAPEYFRDFLTSLFTMFQVLTGDSWASQISRNMFRSADAEAAESAEGLGGKAGSGDGMTETDPAVSFFFISYILINSVTMLNVVVAVLLDEFISSVTREKEEEERQRQEELNRRKASGVLDPLTQTMLTFEDEADLVAKIDSIYLKMDEDENGGLNFEEFQSGLKHLEHAIHLTREVRARLPRPRLRALVSSTR